MLRTCLLLLAGVCMVRGSVLDDMQDYKDHPCIRECKKNGASMTCKYDLTIEWYYTLSKACYNCPLTPADCDRRHCVAANGIQRGIITVNRMMPGPAIHVCQGDIIEATVHNRLQNGEGTSIHWHGVHQKTTPFMDGVTMLTQCPITEYTSFTYKFPASNAGSHYYHTHAGMQRADGLYGAFVVRQPKQSDPNKDLFNKDLPEHTIILMDWMNDIAANNYGAHHQSHVLDEPDSVLVNGKGAYRMVPVPEGDEFQLAYTPREVVNVNQGSKYLIRLISNGIMNCPLIVSIDNHQMTLIASDGVSFKPLTVDYFTIFAGERYDLVINADKAVGNYWIKFKGDMECVYKKVHQTAILRYKGAPDALPPGGSGYDDMNPVGVNLNAYNVKHSELNRNVASLDHSTPALSTDPIAQAKADRVLYFALGFNKIDNSVTQNSVLYPISNIPESRQFWMPQINHISLTFPPVPPMSQFSETPMSAICNAGTLAGTDCKNTFCECVHVEFVELNQVVEMVVVDEGYHVTNHHPMHLHGFSFKVVAQDKLGDEVSIDKVKAMNEAGQIPKKLMDGIEKDTINIPDGGYVVLRFVADAPGLWAFHCHLAFHAEIGMAVVLAVGVPSKLPTPPPGFPTCGNFQNTGPLPP